MTENKSNIFNGMVGDPLDPETLNNCIHNILVNVTYYIEQEAAKLNDVIKEDLPISYLYPIRVKILEEKNNLNRAVQLLEMVREHKRLAKKEAN